MALAANGNMLTPEEPGHAASPITVTKRCFAKNLRSHNNRCGEHQTQEEAGESYRDGGNDKVRDKPEKRLQGQRDCEVDGHRSAFLP